MAKTAKIAWGIDIGNCTLKAIKLAHAEEGAEILDFAFIEHDRILTEADLNAEDRLKLINKALEKFLEDHDISHSDVVVSVPGQSSFARFVKLPPVEKKRIPELVRYEAIQQIPFDIEDVEYDWQTFEDEDSPEVEVGIFAIKRDIVKQALKPFSQSNCLVHKVQMAPMALNNFLRYDQEQFKITSSNNAIIVIDIGAENTDLLIIDGKRVWQRNIPIGGNQFTAAVQKAFKLSFAKAEAIKRTASTSKYARQIFQAMRTIFADLAAEIQRSLGFYSSSNRDVTFREVLALGNAMKLPGLLKFLQQSLSLPVKRLDNFDSAEFSEEVSVTQFSANISSMAVAYGLALQGIGNGLIDINLLPREVVRETAWQRKRKWFVAASAGFLLAGAMSLFQAMASSSDINAAKKNETQLTSLKRQVDASNSEKLQYMAAEQNYKKIIADHADLYMNDNLVPRVVKAIYETLPGADNNPDPRQQKLYEAFQNGDLETVLSIDRKERQQIFLTSVQVVYTENLNQQFEQIVKTRTASSSSGSSSSMGSGMMGDEMMMMEMMMMGGMDMFGGAGGMSSGMIGSGGGGVGILSEEVLPGFVVVLEGYTPHKDGLLFLNPPEVGDDRDKWGFIKRLEYLGRLPRDESTATAAADSDTTATTPGITDFNSIPPVGNDPAANAESPLTDAEKAILALPFETYIGEGERREFFDDSETGYISGDTQEKQPIGLGIEKPEDDRSKKKAVTSSAKVKPLKIYLDPFTYEPISEEYMYDENNEIVISEVDSQPIRKKNDYWFRIKVKLKLKENDQAADGAQP